MNDLNKSNQSCINAYVIPEVGGFLFLFSGNVSVLQSIQINMVVGVSLLSNSMKKIYSECKDSEGSADKCLAHPARSDSNADGDDNIDCSRGAF